MAFRKRNVGLSRNPQDSSVSSSATSASVASTISKTTSLAGTRASPIDGRLVTSTGVSSLDDLLAGHSGLALGSSLLVEENGTTDYGGALLKYFAAEGVVQGHLVHVLGMPEAWGRDLPGIVEGSQERHVEKGSRSSDGSKEKDRMKIAWRYEGLGEFGAGNSNRRAVDRTTSSGMSEDSTNSAEPLPFTHTFDLTKKLIHPNISKITYSPVSQSPRSAPFTVILQTLAQALSATSQDTVHRVIVPSLLSPGIYPPHASEPANVLSFSHGIRSLLQQYSTRLVVIFTLPLSLYLRTTSIVRWLEHLTDGVIELTPFPHMSTSELGRSGASTKEEEKPQGLVKLHKLPIFHDRGGGAAGKVLGEDMAFTVSRRKFEIKPFSLPPAEGDTEAQAERQTGKVGDSKAMEF